MNYQKIFSTVTGLTTMASLLVSCVQQPIAPATSVSEVEPVTSTPVPPPVTPTSEPPTPSPGDTGQHTSPTPKFETTEIEPEQQQLSDSPKINKQTNCPDLESTLFQITQSPDPLRLAEQLQLKIKEDKVQVLLILASEDTSFLKNFEVEIGTQVGVQVQAFVPVDQLCNLANATEVLAARLPAEALPQK